MLKVSYVFFKSAWLEYGIARYTFNFQILSGDIKSCNKRGLKKSHCYRGYNLLGPGARGPFFIYHRIIPTWRVTTS